MTINDRLALIDTLATELSHATNDATTHHRANRIRTATAHLEHDLRQIEIQLRDIITTIHRPSGASAARPAGGLEPPTGTPCGTPASMP